MDEMPGMIRPDLQALPQVKDRIFSPPLFPAHAGVIPMQPAAARPQETFPRIRGGDPDWQPCRES